MTEPKAAPQDEPAGLHTSAPDLTGEVRTPACAAPMPEEPTPLKLWRSREPIGSIWREIADYADTLRARCEELQREGYVWVPRDVVENIGMWLSAAMDDERVCQEMKRDIQAWLDATYHDPLAASEGKP